MVGSPPPNGKVGSGSVGTEVHGPLYRIADIQAYAEKGKVSFHPNAEDDYIDLGFSKEEAIECIASLLDSEYRKSLSYDQQQPFDDYVAQRYCKSKKCHKPLYIKLRIPNPRVVDYVFVVSFHISNGA